MIGQTISHYKIVEKLGEGGMGVVYKAQDTKLDRLVALKFLPSEYTRDPQAKQRFIHEAKAASALDHPNICTIYEIGETPDGQTFIAMACYEGETLHEKIANQPLTIDDAVSYAIQTAEGLQAAHKKGITHRDIKSSNIMVTTEGQVKIMDFGLAKTTTGTVLTKTGATVGTVPYMSPEQARGEKVDHRTDIWSLGVAMYEMLTGRLPFESPYSEAVIYSILNEEPKPFSLVRNDVPAKVESIVKKCLQKNLSHRYQHVDELLADLRRVKTEPAKEMPSQKVLQPIPFRRRTWYLIGGAVLAVTILFIALFPPFTGREEAIRSIAVLPLENLSRDPEQEYFADGMTEALITNLAKISSLRVISRTSVMLYKTRKKSIPEIAKELNVDAVVEGSVQRSGDRVRITAQLVRAPADEHLWAESYERNFIGILSLQNEIALAIAKEIRAKVTPQEESKLSTARPVNYLAYESYLKGRFFWNKRTIEGFEKAAEYFQHAIAIDSNDALAYSGLADCYIVRANFTLISPREAFPKAKEAAQRALKIDETLAEAHTSLGMVTFRFDWDWPGAEAEFRRALEINPNYEVAHNWYGIYLLAMGRLDEASAEMRRARELEPLSLIANTVEGWPLYFAGRYDEAITLYQRSLEIDPNFFLTHWYLGLAYEQKGDYDSAFREFNKALSAQRNTLTMASLGHLYAVSGKSSEARKILEDLKVLSKKEYVSPHGIAQIYLGLGETDQALQWLEKGFEERSSYMVYINVDPIYRSIRSHPRFLSLLRKIGLENFQTTLKTSALDNEKLSPSSLSVHQNSIAVLPFKNISPDKEQEYFCDGMTEAIITDLAKVGELIVMSPAAVARYKGKSTNPIEIGRELRVQYLVEGSVQRMGTALRVSAQLTNTETGAQVWADRFDRTTREVFKVQDDLSRRIVGALQLKVGPKAERSRPAQNFDAYDTFLRGRFYLRKQSVKEVDRAVALLEQAVQMDPNYAPALASLGMAYIQKSFYDEPLKREWEEKAFIIIEKALLMDPNLAEAYVAKGNLLWTPANRFPHEKTIAAYRRAIELNPNLDEAHEWLGLVYYHVGLMDAGLEECRKALQINPSSGFAQSRLGINLLYSGRYEEALAELRKVPEGFSPQIVPAQAGLTLSYLGRMKEAKAVVEEGLKQLPDDPFLLSAQALLFAKEGQVDEAIHKIRQAERREKTYLGHFHHAAYNIGSAYALLGKNSLAVEWLRKAAENGFPCYPKYDQDPNLNTLRQDPIFTILMNDLRKQWEKYKTMIR